MRAHSDLFGEIAAVSSMQGPVRCLIGAGHVRALGFDWAFDLMGTMFPNCSDFSSMRVAVLFVGPCAPPCACKASVMPTLHNFFSADKDVLCGIRVHWSLESVNVKIACSTVIQPRMTHTLQLVSRDKHPEISRLSYPKSARTHAFISPEFCRK